MYIFSRLDIDLPVRIEDPLCTSYQNGEKAMFCVGVMLDCFLFNGTGFEPVASPTYMYDQAELTNNCAIFFLILQFFFMKILNFMKLLNFLKILIFLKI